MKINKETLTPYLLFNNPIKYTDNITLSPIRMKDILLFQRGQESITLRKEAIFQEKIFLKMSYFEFLKYAYRNEELAIKYKNKTLPYYFEFAISLLMLSCKTEEKDAEIKINNKLDVSVNGEIITNEMFDDLRRIIIFQNDIDFDIDEFMNIDTLNALEKARAYEAKKSKEKYELEDYIDSLIIALQCDENYVENLTIRKFWRYIKRISKHEYHQAAMNGQMSGMVKFKEPVQNWMATLEVEDKYANLKADEKELKEKLT